MSFSSLSSDLWQRIFRYARQADRARASAVSKAMQAAAVAAMTDVLECDQPKLDSLQLWLPKHGEYVTRFVMDYSASGVVLANLPCPHLLQLKLGSIDRHFSTGVQRGVQVVLAASDHGPGLLQACMGLTRLCWCDCRALDDLAGLTVLTALKQLDLISDSKTDWFPGSVLQHCSHLTYLRMGLQAEDLQHISCLRDLQKLVLFMPTLSHITYSTLPGGLPASLRQLICMTDVLDPLLLSPLTNLQMLELSGLHGDYLELELEGAAAGDALFSTIAQLQQLQDLELDGLNCEWPRSPNVQSALTASSNLTRLELACSTMPTWEHIFSPGCALRFLIINSAGTWSAPQLQRAIRHMVTCCPKLQYLELELQPGVDMAALAQLSALTALEASNQAATDAGEACQTIQGCAVLTGLQDLRLSFDSCGALEPSALLPLTALQRLTRLRCLCVFEHMELHEANCSVNIVQNAWGPGDLTSTMDPPDVWLQLLRCCQHPGQASGAQDKATAAAAAQLPEARPESTAGSDGAAVGSSAEVAESLSQLAVLQG